MREFYVPVFPKRRSVRILKCRDGVEAQFAFSAVYHILTKNLRFMSAIALKNGLVMPSVGLGTWKSQPGEVKVAVYEALKLGYRHLDCAWEYKNQHEVGEGIAQAISEGLVKREDFWVTSKLWNDFHAEADVEPHLRETLEQLQLEYLDLFLIHWPATSIEAPTLTPPYSETWAAMEGLVEQGLVKSIGVSNMTIKKLEAMKEFAKIAPVVCQGEMHPLFRQDELLQYCKGEGIHWTAYSPLGSSDSADKFHHTGHALLKHDTVLKVAAETEKSPGQVLIRWALQHGSAVIPKSVHPERIRENFEVWDWALSAEQFEALSSLTPQARLLLGDYLVKPGGPYKSVAELWDEA
jgi:diketogulonate reductase-like aldo/keto reductase